jgi:outer membrane murein-binding lipoprotein Lpp
MISAILSTLWPYLLAGIGALAAVFGIYTKGRSDAKAKAEAKILKRTIAAKDEQLEMHREATAAERQAAAMTEANARREAEKWARR